MDVSSCVEVVSSQEDMSRCIDSVVVVSRGVEVVSSQEGESPYR